MRQREANTNTAPVPAANQQGQLHRLKGKLMSRHSTQIGKISPAPVRAGFQKFVAAHLPVAHAFLKKSASVWRASKLGALGSNCIVNKTKPTRMQRMISLIVPHMPIPNRRKSRGRFGFCSRLFQTCHHFRVGGVETTIAGLSGSVSTISASTVADGGVFG